MHALVILLFALLAAVSAQPGISVTVYDAVNCASSSAGHQLTYYLNNDWTQCQAIPDAEGRFMVGHARCEDNQLIVEYCGNKSCSVATCFGPTTATASGQCSSNLFLSSGSIKVTCPDNTHQQWLDQRPYIVAWVGTGVFFLTTVIFFILFCKARHSDHHIRV